MRHFFFSAGIVLILLLLFLDYRNYRNPGEHFFGHLETPAVVNDIANYEFTPEHLTMQFDATRDAFYSFAFPVKLSFPKRLQLDFSRLQGVSSISVYYRLEGDRGFSEGKRQRQVIKAKKYSYDFLLPSGTYDSLRIDFDGYAQDATVIVKDLLLLDNSVFFYTQSYFHLLTIVFLVLLILPGTLLFTLSADRTRLDPESNLLLFFVLSLVFYVVLYGVLEISHRLAINPRASVLTAFVLLLAVLAGLVYKMKRLDILKRIIRSEKKAFIAVLALSIICGILVTGLVRSPFSFDAINWDTVDGEVIFARFTGHDNMFQYINGMAIANNEPFAKYYAGGKLMFDVQDREILGGVVYAVFRTLASSISPYVGESYLTYTLFGLCMNLMVVFPGIVLLRRYFRNSSVYLFVLLLSANTFVLGNYSFTWFKFSGAALFISGTLILLRDRKSLPSWFLAGLAYGLSANMHAGNALGIPLIFLLLIYLNVKEEGIRSKTVWAYPPLLCLIFLLANVPWALVKSYNFPDRHALFFFHYLPGSVPADGLFKNIGRFFDKHPVQEQLTYRLLNLYDSLRFPEVADFFSQIPGKTDRLLYIWSDLEFCFFSTAIYPVLIIATVCLAVRFYQSRMVAGGGTIQLVDPRHQEFRALLAVSFCTIVGLILLSYHDYPDATWHLPMGIILIIQIMLIGFSLNNGLLGKGLLLAYGCFSIWRISRLFMYFLGDGK